MSKKKLSKEQSEKILKKKRFPRSNKYDFNWVMSHQMGPNVLWLTEWLCEAMRLEPGMRVLDMGCGKAISSIFMAKEFGVQVWATDLWISAKDNWERIRDAGLEKQVFPIHAEAHELPYAEEFFDSIVCIDSYIYYGTDDLYLNYFQKFVRPGGQIGIVVPGLTQDFNGPVPEHLLRMQKSGGTFWTDDCFCFHTAEWWRKHWARINSMNVELADTLPDGWRYWLEFEQSCVAAGKNHFPSDEEALTEDAGKYIGLVRMVGRKSLCNNNKGN